MNSLKDILESYLGKLHVALPAEVVRYDHTKQKADVQPLLKRVYRDGRVERMPIIYAVPVIFPRTAIGAGDASMTFPVRPKDTVLLLFSDRSLDEWAQHGGEVAPDDRRKHDLSDAIAVPGLIPFGLGSMAENNDDVFLTYHGNKLRLKPNGNSEWHVDTSIDLRAGKTITVTAGERITLQVGNSRIELTPGGVEIDGNRIDLN